MRIGDRGRGWAGGRVTKLELEVSDVVLSTAINKNTTVTTVTPRRQRYGIVDNTDSLITSIYPGVLDYEHRNNPQHASETAADDI